MIVLKLDTRGLDKGIAAAKKMLKKIKIRNVYMKPTKKRCGKK